MQEKECNTCKTTKPKSEFYFSKRNNCLQYQCKICAKAAAKEWARNNRGKVNKSAREHYQKDIEHQRQYAREHYQKIKDTEHQKEYLEENRDKRNENSKRWDTENPGKMKALCKKWKDENPERMKVLQTRWCIENPEKTREATTRWRENNPERAKLLAVTWVAENPEKVRASRSRRRAWVKQSGGSFIGADIIAMFKRQRGKCVACAANISKDYHIDHVMPLALGGSNNISNIQLLCPHCNLSKNARHPVDFMQAMGFLL